MIRVSTKYYPIRNVFFVVGEGAALFTSVFVATFVLQRDLFQVSPSAVILKILLVTVVIQACFYYNDLYNLQVTDSYLELSIRLLQAFGYAAIFLAGLYYLLPDLIVGRGIFAASIGIFALVVSGWRYLYTIILNRGWFNRRIMLIGNSDLASKVEKEILEKRDCGFIIVARLGLKQLSNFYDHADVIVQESLDRLSQIANEKKVDDIVVALEDNRGNFPSKELLRCRTEGISVRQGSSFYEMLTGKLLVEHINPGWLIYSDGFRKSALRYFLKRMVDLAVSLILVIVLSPVIIITSLLIKLDSRGPVFFTQDRVGVGRKEYRVFKFRSMVEDAEKKSGPVWAKEDDDRITRVGRVIRKLRIDEIPQIINVLKGDMSFVGPRPERAFFVAQLEEMVPYYAERFSVKPGITGWAQVSYGYGASVDDAIEKLNYDLYYIKNMSFLMDFMILLKTIKIVLFGKGAR